GSSAAPWPQPPQPAPPRPPRLTDMGKAPFYPLAAQPLQALAFGPAHPPPVVAVGPLLSRRLVRPGVLVGLLRLRDVRPVLGLRELRDRLDLVIALVRGHLLDLGVAVGPHQVQLGREHAGPQRGAVGLVG